MMKNDLIHSKPIVLHISEEELKHYGPLVENFILSNPWVKMTTSEIGLYDLFNNKYLLYLTKSNKNLQELYNLGFTHQRSPEFFFKYLTQSDVRFIRDSIDQVVAFLQEKEEIERKEYVLLLDASVQHPNGKYYRFVHQSIVFESKGVDHDWLVLCLLTLIDTNGEKTKPLRLFHAIDSLEPCLSFTEKKKDMFYFTPKEQELIWYIAQGLDTNDIAQKEYRSKNTINNQKAKLMEKLSIYKMPQLINYANTIGLL